MIGFLALLVLNLVMLRAAGLPAFLSRVVRVIAAYVAVAYTLRAFVLLVLQPKPGARASVGIPWLYPAYSDGLNAVLGIVGLGMVLLLVTIHASHHLLYVDDGSFLRIPVFTGVVVYALGTALRLPSILLGDSPGISDKFFALGPAMASTGVAAVILGSDWRRNRHLTHFGLPLMVGSELIFSVAMASKTPILTIVLLFYLDPRRPTVTLRVAAGAVAAILVSFTAIQGLKESATTTTVAQDGFLLRVYYALTGRLDGLVSMSAAWFNGPGSYTPEGGMGGALLRSVAPDVLVGGDKVLAGYEWGRHIYGAQSRASFAEGIWAEGYAVLGMGGVVIWSIVAGALIVIAATWIRQTNGVFLWVGLAFLSSTAVFERGLLGQAEHLGVSLQVGLVSYALSLLSRSPVPNAEGAGGERVNFEPSRV